MVTGSVFSYPSTTIPSESPTKIESRPSRQGNWDYVFFIDIDGHQNDTNVEGALEALRQEARMLKILGSYPKAVL